MYLGVTQTSNGINELGNAIMLYNDYKNNPKEVNFTALYPEFSTREDALKKARELKCKAIQDICLGATTSLFSTALGYYLGKKIFHKKAKPQLL